MPAAARGTRRVSLLIAAAVVVIVGVVYYVGPQFLKIVEFNLYDVHFRLRGPRPPNPNIVIVSIDEASLARVGRWPWSRTVLADLVRALDRAGAATIAFDTLLSEPERSSDRAVIERLMRRLGAQADPAVRRELQRMLSEADPDGALAAAIREVGHVVLPVDFALAPGDPTGAPARAGQPMKSALPVLTNPGDAGRTPPPRAERETFPIPPLAAAATAVGHVHMIPEIDGSTRYETVVIESRGYYYPSLAVQAVGVAGDVDPFQLKLTLGNSLRIGDLAVPIEARARVLIDYAGPSGTIPHLSAADVLEGKGVDRVKGRLVFVGATAEGLYDLRVTPVSPIMPGVEKHANMAGNILDQRFIVRPSEIELFEAAGIVLLPLLFAMVLPALRPVPSIAVTLAVFTGLYAAAHYAFLRGVWIPVLYPWFALLATFVSITAYRFLTEERQRMYTRKAFQQYVSREVVERIMEHPEALQFGGELRNLTVLFSDIRDFTTFTEKHDPHLVVQMLREYLTHMTEIVIREGGTLDKYIGDAVMAEFGAPIAYPDHALRGCRAALAMSIEVGRLTEKWKAEGKEPFRIGLGVNTGDMVVGNLGSEQLFDYTVIGDGVNLGARLESLNKEYQTTTHIIISEETYAAAKDAIEVRELGEVKVKGKTRPVVIYELCGLKTTPGV
jgi:adenylate cyclase